MSKKLSEKNVYQVLRGNVVLMDRPAGVVGAIQLIASKNFVGPALWGKNQKAFMKQVDKAFLCDEIYPIDSILVDEWGNIELEK